MNLRGIDGSANVEDRRPSYMQTLMHLHGMIQQRAKDAYAEAGQRKSEAALRKRERFLTQNAVNERDYNAKIEKYYAPVRKADQSLYQLDAELARKNTNLDKQDPSPEAVARRKASKIDWSRAGKDLLKSGTLIK